MQLVALDAPPSTAATVKETHRRLVGLALVPLSLAANEVA